MGAFLVAAAVTWLAIRSGFVWWEVAVVFVCAYLGSHMVGGVALKWSLSSMRRLPAPWTIEALDGGFKVIDSNGQSLAYVYGHADQRDAQVAKALTLDEAASDTLPTVNFPLLKSTDLVVVFSRLHDRLARTTAAL